MANVSRADDPLPKGYHVFPNSVATGPSLSELNPANKTQTRNLSSRIKLKGYDYEPELFYVEGSLTAPTLSLKKYVKIDLKNSTKKLYVNIDSLAHRLLLKHADIEEAENTKTLEALILNRSFISNKAFVEFGVYDSDFVDSCKDLDDFDIFMNFYNVIIDKYKTVDGQDKLYLKKGNVKTNFTKESLKQFIVAAWKKFISKEENGRIVNKFLEFGVYDPTFADCFRNASSFKNFLTKYQAILDKYKTVDGDPNLYLKDGNVKTNFTKETLKQFIVDSWKKFSSRAPDGTIINEFLDFGVHDPEFAKCFRNPESFRNFKRYYTDITGNYAEGAQGNLALKGALNQVTGLTAAALKKVIVVAWKKFSTMHAGTQATIEVDGKKFILSREGGKLDIVHDHVYAVVGKGASGTVDKVLHVTSGIFAAFKKATVMAAPAPAQSTPEEIAARQQLMADNNQETEATLHQEQVILKLVKGKSWAQQILMAVNIQNGDIGHLSQLYDGNLESWINTPRPLKERIQCCKQLMQAYVEMAKLNLAHFDLKARNIYVDTSSGRPVFRIGDWGSARRLDVPADQLSHGGLTAEHTSPDVFKLLRTNLASKNVGAFNQAAQKHDLYSLGVLFYQILAGKTDLQPYGNQHQRYPDRHHIDLHFDSEEHLDAHCGAQTVVLIASMCALDPEKQLSLEESAKEWAALSDNPQNNPTY